MCRLAAYLGPAIPLENIIVRPRHSLLVQSQGAREAKMAVNGDGFGFAWYAPGAPEPGQYRDVLPAWSDGNLTSLCRLLTAPLFIAHVRASTTGETSRTNCHPFVSGVWSFAHNGQIGDFERLRRPLEALLPDPLYLQRRGTTDSEVLFLLMLADGLDGDPKGAVEAALARLYDAFAAQGSTPFLRLTCVFADGRQVHGFRHATDGFAPSLYLATRLDHGGRALASEPLDGDGPHWQRVPEDTLVTLSESGASLAPLALPEAATAGLARAV